MASYEVASTIAGVSNSAIAWLRTTASKDARVWEIGVSFSSATPAASTIGLGRPAAISVTPTTITPQAEDPSSAAAGCTFQTAATTKPTSPTVFMRRYGMPGVQGAGVIWTFPRGLIIPTGPAELVVWNIGASTATFEVYYVYDE